MHMTIENDDFSIRFSMHMTIENDDFSIGIGIKEKAKQSCQLYIYIHILYKFSMALV